MKDSTIHHDAKRKEYYLMIGEQRAYIQYQERDSTFYLTYSFVPPALRGQGIGKVLVEKTVEALHLYEQDIVPVCSYIRFIMMRMKSNQK